MFFQVSLVGANALPGTCMVPDLCKAWQNVASAGNVTDIEINNEFFAKDFFLNIFQKFLGFFLLKLKVMV